MKNTRRKKPAVSGVAVARDREVRRPLFEELEPRVLYSADTELLLLNSGAGIGHGALVATYDAAPLSALTAMREASGDAASAARRELVVIDAATPDFQQLVDDILTSSDDGVEFEFLLLDSRNDGVGQITGALAGFGELDAIHIISHGSDGAVQLGNTWLTTANVDDHAQSLGAWQSALAGDADILIYGCDLASGADGRALIGALAELTGADIGASVDYTGSADLGGDWDLEYASGEIATRIAISVDAQESWSAVLVNSAPVVDGSAAHLWLSSIADVTGSAAPGLAAWSDGQVLHFGAPNLGFGENTTNGTFTAQPFNLDTFAGDANIDAIHYVTQAVTVGSGDNALTLLAGDVVLSTAGDENLTSTNSLSVKSEDAFVFRPDTPGDYSSGTFLFLLDNPLGGQLKGLTLVEQDTTVGGALVEAGTFLLSKGDKNIYHFTAATVGETTTTGALTTLVEGPDIGIDQNIIGLDLVETTTTLGGITLSSGEILVTLENEDIAVGGTPIDTERRDVISLQITQTGPTTLGDATLFFDADDLGLSSNDENIDALSLLPAPQLTPIIEDISVASNGGTLVSDLVANLIADADPDPLGIAVTAVDDTNGTWQYSLNGGSTWFAFGAVTDGAAIALTATASDRIRFLPNADYDGAAQLSLRAWDGSDGSLAGDTVDASVNGGTTAFSAATASALIQMRGVNDAPLNTVPVAQVINEDTSVVFSSGNGNLIAVGDVDTYQGEIKVTLAAGNGTITLAGTAGLTFTTGTGSSDSSMSFFGTVADVNAALDGMSFDPNANFSGAASVAITTDDLGHAGTGVALSDADVVNITVTSVNDAPVVDGSAAHLWLSTIADVTGSAAPGLAAWSDGQVLHFGAPNLGFGENTTNGTFAAQPFNLDTFAGDANIDAIHYVTQAVTVGSGDNALTLLAGDVVLSTAGDVNLTSTNSLSVKSEDAFVFRPDTPGDYSSGTFLFLLDNPLGGQLKGLTLVEQDTTVGGTLVEAGTFLLSKGDKNIYHFTAATVGETTTTGVLATLVEGPDIGIDQNIIGLDLVETTTTLGGVTLSSGEILVTLENEDNAVGGTPIDTQRRDVISLQITQTGPTTLGDATLFFDADDLGLSSNDENIDALSLLPAPQLTPIIEDISVASNGGTLVSDLVANLIADADPDPLGIAVTAVDDTNGTWQYSLNGGSTWFAFGAVTDGAAIALTATASDRIRFLPNADYDGAAQLSLRAWDGSDGSLAGDTVDASVNGGTTAFSAATASALIQMRGVNDAPVLDNADAMTLTAIDEDVLSAANTGNTVGQIVLSAGGDRITDVDSAALEGMAVTAVDDANGTWEYSVDGGTIWTAFGAVTDSASVVLRDGPNTLIRFSPDANYDGAASITFRAWDASDGLTSGTSAVDASVNGNDSAFSDATETATISINAIDNDAPVNTLPVAQTAYEDAALVFSTANGNLISIADPDVGGASMKVTLTITNGTLTLSGTTGLSFTTGTGTADTTMVFTGTLADVNAALDGLRFDPAAEYSGAASLTIQSEDQGASGPGVPQSDSDVLAITVTALNDAPQVTVPAPQVINEDQTITFSTGNGNLISVSDIDAGAGDVQVTLSIDHGTLTLATLVGLNFSVGDGTADDTMTFKGTLSEVNAALDGLLFTPDSHYAGAALLDVSLDDQGLSGPGGTLSGRGTVDITINADATNDAPFNSVPGPQSTLEETQLVFSGANGNLIEIIDDAAGNLIEVTLTATNGTVTLGATLGGESVVNTVTGGNQREAQVAVNASGASVVVWRGDDASGQGIFAQRYDADGNPVGAEFLVNTFLTDNQNQPAVAIAADGSFVIVWTSKTQDGDAEGIYAQRYDAAGAAVGPEFRVNTTTALSQSGPDIAMNGAGEFVIVWQSKDQDGNKEGIFARRFDAGGNPLDALDVQVNSTAAGDQKLPAVAMDAAGNFVVVWQSKDQDGSKEGIFARRFDATGPGWGSEIPINTYVIEGQKVPDIAMNTAGQFVIAWQSKNQDGSLEGIFARRYDAAANPLDAAEFQVNSATADNQTAPAVSINAAGDFVIVWQSKNQDFPDGKEGVYAQRYAADGTPQGDEFLVNTTVVDKQFEPSVALRDDGQLWVLWTGRDSGGQGVFGQRFLSSSAINFVVGDGHDDALITIRGTQADINAALDGLIFTPDANFYGAASLQITTDDLGNSNGTPLTDDDTINITVDQVNDAPVVTLPANQNVTENGALLLSSAGVGAISITDSDAGGGTMQVVLNANNGTMTLSGIAGLAFSVGDGTADASMTFTGTLAAINAALDGMSFTPVMNYVGLAAIQISANDQGNTGVGGALNHSGTLYLTVGADATNDPPTNVVPGTQFNGIDVPVVFSVDNGNAIVVEDDAGTNTIDVTLSATNGTFSLELPIASEFQVNSTFADAQVNAQVAMAPNGAYVVVWQSNAQDGSGQGIFAQRYDAFGQAQGAEFQVNTEANDHQTVPVVAMDAAGNFVVAWQSKNQDGDGEGIFAQRFDAGGGRLGIEFQVTEWTVGNQIAPAIAMDLAGNFVVVWQSANQDTSGNGIYGLLFDASGLAQSEEFLVNFTIADNQTAPAVAMDNDGDFVVAWQSKNQDGDGEGIFARRFDANAAALDAADVQINTVGTKHQTVPAVAMDSSGNFVVAWQSENQDGDGMGIFARRFDAFGTPFDVVEFQVNTWTAKHQIAPAVAMSATGEFVVVWQSQDQDGDNEGVFGQWFDNTGTALGGEIQLSVTSAKAQTAPSVGIDSAGNFIAAWTSDDQDGDKTGIFAGLLPSGNAINFITGDGNDDALMRFTGTLAHINAALDGLTFTSAPGFNGTATLQITVDDLGNTGVGGPWSDTDTVFMTFNDAPVLDNTGTMVLNAIGEDIADAANVGTLVSDIIASGGGNRITDPNAGALEGVAVIGVDNTNGSWQYSTDGGSSWLSFGAVAAGSATLLAATANDRIRFVPNANYNGVVPSGITFRAWDTTDGRPSGDTGVDTTINGGNASFSSATETAGITVNPANDPPTAASNTVVTPEDTTYVVTVADLGYSDVEGDALTQIQIASLETAGSLQLSGVDVVLNQVISVADITAGNLTFAPVADANGAGYDSFNFRVHDGSAYSASAYTLTVDVTPVNDLPTAANNAVVTPEDTTYVLTVADFGFADIDGDSLAQVQISALESAGTLQLSGVDVVLNQVISVADIVSGNLTFAPAADANGAGYDSFGFRVHDGTAYSAASYTMTIDVTAVNDLPTATNDTVITPEDTTYVFTLADLGYSDVEGDALTQIQISSLESLGSLQLSGVDVVLNQVISVADITGGNLTFAPAADANGASYDSFDFRVHDGTTYSAAAYTLTVDVTPVDDLPTSANNTVVTPEDTTYVLNIADFGFTDVDGDSLVQVQITSLETVGTLQLSGVEVVLNQVITVADITAGNLTFAPVADANGAGYDSFDFRVHDGTSYSAASYTLTVDVTVVNDLPTAANNTVVTPEDTTYVLNVADFGFADIDGDSLAQVQITALESAGSLQLSGVDVVLNQVISVADITAGNLTFAPATDANGAGYDSFDFRVHDGTIYSSAAYTMTIDVTAANDLPTAANDTVITPEDTTYVFTLSDLGYSDVEGDALTQIQITSLETTGSLELSGVDVVPNQVISVADITAGNLTFTPAADANGAGYDNFDFRVHDGTAYSAASYTLTIDVTAVNDAPTAANNTVVTPEDTTYVVTVADLGYSDVEGDALTQIQITSLETAGLLQLSGVDVVLNQVISVADITAGNLTFTPAANANGAGYDSFNFRVHDGSAYSASSYTLTVDVTPVNDLPTAANNTVVTPEDTTYVVTVADLGYSDVEGDALTQIQITSLETTGSLQLSGVDVVLNQIISVADITAGNLTFTPVADANGAGYDSFNFRVHDGSAYSASSYTLTVDVTPVNDLPTAANNTVVTPEDTTYVLTVADFGFTDIDGDSLAQVQITAVESAGTLQLSGVDVVLNQVISVADIVSGNLTFAPAANANGAGYDSFNFRVHDGTAYSAASYTMTIDVTVVNDLPSAANNTVVTPEDTTYVLTVADFGFTDVDGDSLVQVQITALESAWTLQLSGVDVVLNQVISVADITAGNLTLTPAADANGAGYDSFDFRVHDGSAYSASSYTLTVDVTPVNDLPTAANNTVVTPEDTTYVLTVADFGFTDVDGDSLAQVQITSLETVGSLQLSGVDVVLNQVISVADITAGNLTFTPVADANGAGYDSFNFRVHDGTVYSAAAYTLTIDVTAVNDVPTAANNTVVTPEDTTYVLTVADFGFADIDGDSLAQVQITALESAGSLQLSGVDVVLNQVITVADITAGNLTFAPAADANGAGYDSFDFRVHDGSAYSASSYTLTVDVTPVNDLPTAANNTVVTPEDTTYVLTVADFGFTDVDGDSLAQVQITSLETVGSLQLSGVDVVLNQVISVADITAGNLTFTPVADANGAGYDSFNFRVHDGTVYSAAAYTLTIDVTAVNDVPTAANNTVVTPEDTTYVLTVADFGFADIDGDSLAQVQITALESAGSLQLSGVDVVLNQVITVADITAGNLTLTPAADANGAGYDSFNFRVHDGMSYSTASYTLTVDVTPVNDLPTAANNTVVTPEDTTYVVTVADLGYSDVEGDALTQIQITSLETAGSLQLSGVDVVLNQVISVADITAGNLTFTPVADANGAGYDSFNFRVHDGTVYSAAAYTLTIDVTAVNDVPTAANNTVVTPEDTTYVLTVADFGFADIDGDSLAQVQITAVESAGTLQLSGVDVVLNQVISVADIVSGNLTFAPAADANGAGYDSFNFRVHDGTSYSTASYTLTVDVTPVNDLPTAANNTVVTPEDTAYVLTAADFGFADINGDSLVQVQITSLETTGSLQLSGVDVVLNQVISVADITAGNLTFATAADGNGVGYDSFDFRVHDGSAYSASSYTLNVDVTPVNDLPTAANITVVTPEDTTYVLTVADFGFTDVDGDSLAQVQITSLETVGSLQLSGVDVVLNQVISVADITAGNLTFAPVADANGAGYDSFDFRVHDGTAYSAAAYTLTIDVTAVNDVPTAANNTVVTPEDTTYVLTVADFGFADIDGDSLAQVQITALESAGTLQLSGVDIVLNQVISVADITAGNLTFTPAANANGAGYDSFNFRVHDGSAYSASSYTLTVDVTPVNDLPTAANNTVVTPEDTTYVFTLSDLGYSDVEGDALTQIQISSLESLGSLQLSGVDVVLNQVISAADIASGSLTFASATNANGASYDSIDFLVHDGTAYSAVAYTLTINVTAVNDLPTAANNTVVTLEDTTYVVTVADFGFTDIDGDSLVQVQITSLESAGSLQLSGVDVVLNQVISAADITAGNLTFAPVADASGAGYDSFDFRVHDGSAYSAVAYTLTIDVTAVNDAPTAANNTVVTPEDTTYVFTLSDLGYSDVEGDALTQIQISSLESLGSLQLSGVDVVLNQVISVADITAGNLTFTPAADANGAGYDSFNFRVHDGSAYSASSYTLTVDVTTVNDLPTAANNTVVTPEDTTYVLTVADFGFTDIDGDSLAQVQITALESAGSLQLSGVDVVLNQVISVVDITAGNLTFAPVADAIGAGYDSFDFRVHDGTAYSAAAYTLTIDVTAVNDAPSATNNTVVTPEDTTYVLTVADFGFTDIDGDSLVHVHITSLETAGSLQLSGVDVVLNQVITVADITAGNLTFAPAADGNGAGYDSFDFRVHDGTAYSTASYTLTVDVTVVNDLPTAANNTVVTPEDTTYVLTVADFGFADIDGDSLVQVQITSLEKVGSLQLFGVDVVLNQVISVADITGGNLTFAPAADANGAGYDSFDFRAHDGTAYSAAAYTLTIDVTAVNDVPTAANNTVVTPEDTSYVLTVADFGFADIDGDSLVQVQITALESAGSLQLSGVDVVLNQVITVADITAGNLTFAPVADANGAGYDSFGFRVHDGSAYSASAYTMTVDVAPVNDLPTAANNTVVTPEDTTYVLTAANFGFADIDGDSLVQVQITSLETTGSLQLSGVDVVLNQVISVADITAGNLTFAPAADGNGVGYDSFDFRVHDGSTYSASAYTLTVDVTPVDDLPTAANDTVVTSEDTTLVFSVADFGFADVDGDSLTQVEITSLETAASLQLSGVDVVLNQVIDVADIVAGNLTFTPVADANGAGYESFDFRVHDGTSYSTAAYTLTIDVTAVNDLPAAANNTVVTPEDTAFVFSVADFGFTDIDGDSLAQVQITALESAGSLQLSGVDVVLNQVISVVDITAGNLTFSPAADANGAGYGSFDFRVYDGTEYGTSSNTMTIDVMAVNDLPTATNNTVVTLEDTTYVFTIADIGFGDVDGDALAQIRITGLESAGSLQLSGVDVVLDQIISAADIDAGDLTFTPATGANGDGYANFDFRVHDGAGYSTASYALTIDVESVNYAPNAINDAVLAVEDTPLVIDGSTLLGNDLDIDGDTLSISDFQQPQFGTLIDNGDGTFTYAPAADFHGSDSFTYAVSDGNGEVDNATVAVTVGSVNDAPTTAGESFITDSQSSLLISIAGLLANDFDVDGDSLAVVEFSQPRLGTLLDNGNGDLTYVPGPADTAIDSFTYTITDGNGAQQTASVLIVVYTNEPPADDIAPATGDPDPGPDEEATGPSSSDAAPTESVETIENEDQADERADALVAAVVEPDTRRPQVVLAEAVTPAALDNHSIYDAERSAAAVNNRSATVREAGDTLVAAAEKSHAAKVSAKLGLSITSNETLSRALDMMMGAHDGADEDGRVTEKFVAGTIKGSSAVVLAAALHWILRGGALATALFSSLPIWMRFDPLPILSASKAERVKMKVDAAKEKDKLSRILASNAAAPVPRKPTR